MFQSLRINAQFFILHKDANPYVETGTVVNVSAPQMKFPLPQNIAQPQEMVVDVTININGTNQTYQKLPANQDVADFGTSGNIVVATSRDALSAEVVGLKKISSGIVESVEYHRGLIASYDSILQQLNPEYREKQQQQAEINELKTQLGQMSQSVSELMELNKQLMADLKSERNSKSKN